MSKSRGLHHHEAEDIGTGHPAGAETAAEGEEMPRLRGRWGSPWLLTSACLDCPPVPHIG